MTAECPHRQAGKTPESRARQLANLTPQSALKHGGYSAEKLQPERERVLGELLASFGQVRRDRLELLAAQRARITLLQAYLDQRGIIAHRGRGSVFPAVDRLQREEVSYRAELSRVEELSLAAGAANRGGALAAIVAEITAAEQGDDQGGE